MRSDVWGFITLDALSAVPKLSVEEKLKYYGPRRGLAGGPLDDMSDKSDEDDDESASDEAAGVEPITFHALPTSLFSDIIKAYSVKHVIDFSPSPMHVGISCLKLGVSYCAFCATEHQQTFLQNQLFNDLKAEVVLKTSPLFNSRCLNAAAEERDVDPDMDPDPDDDGDDDDEEQGKDEGNEGEEPEKQTPGTLPKTKAIAKTKGTRKACIVFIHKTIQITSK